MPDFSVNDYKKHWNLSILSYLCTPFKFKTMKKDIHPQDYRLVVFRDISIEESFLTKSCAPSKETVKWTDGNEYPLVKLEISNRSHPFFTGKMKFVDTAGRIDKFKKKFAKFSEKNAMTQEEDEPAKAADQAE